MGGDDGKLVRLINTTAKAHVITVGTAGHGYINGGKNVITFGGAIGDYVNLMAYQGVWYTIGSGNVTLSGS